jgi:hypothetical protein
VNNFVRRDVGGLMEKFLVVALLLVGCGGSSFEAPSFNSKNVENDAGTVVSSGGGAGVEEDGGAETGGSGSGGKTGAGGVVNVETGDASSGGRALGTGGLREVGGTQGSGGASTGGAINAAGGTQNSGGAQDVDSGGCALVAHSNGLGQSWQDCMPLGTYNEAQAMKACKAYGATRCIDSLGCGGGNLVVIGRDLADALVGAWGYSGFVESFVCSGATCSGCPSSGLTWN